MDGELVGAEGADMTKREASTLDHVGWFSVMFAAVAGAPSVLSILDGVFVQYNLLSTFQWVVDGYNSVVGIVAALFEPSLLRVAAWLNASFGWDLVINEKWRALFMLSLIVGISYMRIHWNERLYEISSSQQIKSRWSGCLLILGSGLGAMIFAFIPTPPVWWIQGLAAALPLSLAAFLLVPVARVFDGPYMAAGQLYIAGIALCSLFIVGSGLAFIPAIAGSAAIISIMMFTFVWGLVMSGAADNRWGLTILGGFVLAGLIVVADHAVRS